MLGGPLPFFLSLSMAGNGGIVVLSSAAGGSFRERGDRVVPWDDRNALVGMSGVRGCVLETKELGFRQS